MWWHGITHDLSKFSPKEFIPYAKYFYGDWDVKIERSYPNKENYTNGQSCLSNSYLKCKNDFDNAWKHHYKNNKHHWEYWIGKDMPYRYREQMLCDWRAMGRKFGDTAQEYYLNNYFKFDMTYYTRMMLEHDLDLNFSEYHNYGHIMQDFANMYDRETYNNYFGFIREKYGIDSYKILKD